MADTRRVLTPSDRDGCSAAARRLFWALPKLTTAEAGWWPLKGGGLELVDRQVRSSG